VITTTSDKLNNLLLALKPDLVQLKELLKKAKDINSPYQAKFRHLISLTNMQLQLEKKNNIEGYISLIVEELQEIIIILNQVMEDDGVRDLYEIIFNDFFKLQEKIAIIVESRDVI